MKKVVIREDLAQPPRKSGYIKFFLALLCCSQIQVNEDDLPIDQSTASARSASSAPPQREGLAQTLTRFSSDGISVTPSSSIVLLHPMAATINLAENKRGRSVSSVTVIHSSQSFPPPSRSRSASMPLHSGRPLVRTGQFQDARDLAIMRGRPVPPLYTLYRPPPLSPVQQQNTHNETKKEEEQKITIGIEESKSDGLRMGAPI